MNAKQAWSFLINNFYKYEGIQSYLEKKKIFMIPGFQLGTLSTEVRRITDPATALPKIPSKTAYFKSSISSLECPPKDRLSVKASINMNSYS